MGKGYLSPTATPSKSERDYQAEDDFRTLKRSDEVTSDRGRHKRALAHGKREVKTISRVIGGGRR